MRNKLLILVLLIIGFCLGVSIGTGLTTYAYAAENSITISSTEKIYYDNVKKSVEIYNTALSSFSIKKETHNGDESTSYNDDF